MSQETRKISTKNNDKEKTKKKNDEGRNWCNFEFNVANCVVF